MPSAAHHCSPRPPVPWPQRRTRESIASWLGVRPAQVHLTSSVQAALHFGLDGLLASRPQGALALSAVESLTLLEAADASGRDVEILPVDPQGRLLLDTVPAEPDWAVACLQAANAEVGTVQPVAELAALLSGSGTPILMDATGCLGRMSLQPGASALAGSARDWGGPAGLGILVIGEAVAWTPPRGSQRGWLGGFPDIPAAAAAGIAAETLAAEWRAEAVRAHAAIARIRDSIAAGIPEVEIVGDPGAGKSTAGRHLAHALNLPFFDADHELEKLIGMSIRSYFELEGEAFEAGEEFLQLRRTGGCADVLGQLLGIGGKLRAFNQLGGHRCFERKGEQFT